MNAIIKVENAVNIFGVPARAFGVVAADDGRILNQKIKATRHYREGGHNYSITVSLRFDDECNNGRESFSATADIREDGREYMCGCCHDEIAARFPECAPFLKWHLCSTDGPMHYLSNTLYHAGDRDCNGLLKGEMRQIRNGKTGLPCWILTLAREGVKAEQYVDAETAPAAPSYCYAPWNRIGEGKARELDHARSSAVWPDATDAELCAPDLADTLRARLPALLAAFKADMLALGFTWPADRAK